LAAQVGAVFRVGAALREKERRAYCALEGRALAPDPRRRTRCQQAVEQAVVVFEGWTNLRSPQPSQTISAVQDDRSHGMTER
jgi:hypothetical protein